MEEMSETTKKPAEPITVNVATQTSPPPVKAMWICLAIAWVFFIMPIPLTILIAGPMNLAAMIMAVVCIFRNAAMKGAFGLVASTIGSTLVYLIGLALMTALAASA